MPLSWSITPWHVHTFPFFTSTDDRMWDPKGPRKLLYQNLRISMVTEQQVLETRRPNYVTSTVARRLSFLNFLIKAVSTSMRKPESERSKMSLLYAFHERRDSETIAEIVFITLCTVFAKRAPSLALTPTQSHDKQPVKKTVNSSFCVWGRHP